MNKIMTMDTQPYDIKPISEVVTVGVMSMQRSRHAALLTGIWFQMRLRAHVITDCGTSAALLAFLVVGATAPSLFSGLAFWTLEITLLGGLACIAALILSVILPSLTGAFGACSGDPVAMRLVFVESGDVLCKSTFVAGFHSPHCK